MQLPADLANGLVGAVLLNMPHNTPPLEVEILSPVAGGDNGGYGPVVSCDLVGTRLCK